MTNLPAFSLRSRILFWHGALLACVLVAFGLTAHRLQWANELARLDRGLDEPLSLLHRSLHVQSLREGNPPGPRSMPPESYVLPKEQSERFASSGIEFSVWSRNGKLLAHSAKISESSLMPSLAGVVPFVVQRRSRGDMREAFLITPPGECFMVSVSMQSERANAARLGWWLLILGAGVLFVGLLVDAWILRRAIHPVEEIISAAERISQGNLSTRIEMAADSTELGRLTKVLNETFASLDQAFTQQARFSADVAHELRTPVSVIIAEAQGALERERSGDDYRETVSTTLRSARRMSSLIESLLDLARIESPVHTSRQPCDLAVLSTETIASLLSMAETNDIKITDHLETALCEVSTEQVTQVIANLLINAIQHNERGGQVRVTTGVADGSAFLQVENTGPGIPASDLSRVFERFYRADSSRSRKTGGAGLGLAICRAITEAHGGTIRVSSEPGALTCFRVSFPAVGGAA